MYNGHDRMRPQNFNCENFEDWPSAKIGPHENFPLYDTLHRHKSLSQKVTVVLNSCAYKNLIIVMSLVKAHGLCNITASAHSHVSAQVLVLATWMENAH
jgi:hypothetical protein